MDVIYTMLEKNNKWKSKNETLFEFTSLALKLQRLDKLLKISLKNR